MDLAGSFDRESLSPEQLLDCGDVLVHLRDRAEPDPDTGPAPEAVPRAIRTGTFAALLFIGFTGDFTLGILGEAKLVASGGKVGGLGRSNGLGVRCTARLGVGHWIAGCSGVTRVWPPGRRWGRQEERSGEGGWVSSHSSEKEDTPVFPEPSYGLPHCDTDTRPTRTVGTPSSSTSM